MQKSKADALNAKPKKRVSRPAVLEPKVGKKRRLPKPALPETKNPSGLFLYFNKTNK